MQRILFVPLPEYGHILPTISVAQYLISQGYEVVYLTAPQFSEVIKRSGAFLRSILAQDDIGKNYTGQHIWNQFAPDTGRGLKAMRLNKLLRTVLRETGFNLVILDRILVKSYKINVSEIVDGLPYLLFSASLPNWKISEYTNLKSPMLIFCPEQLEIPKFRHQCPNIHYVEPSIRPVDDEWTGKFDLSCKVVLISFGTQSIRYRRLLAQIRYIAELARRQSSLQFILATGITQPSMLNQSLDFPANLVVCERVPQLSLLRNTHVFITHGGLGSVKEAIMAGVPMLVLPESHDQPYNAMRIRYHGLGEAIFPEKQTVDSIETAMLSALSGRYDRNIHTMQECFIAIESARPSRSIIEAYLT